MQYNSKQSHDMHHVTRNTMIPKEAVLDSLIVGLLSCVLVFHAWNLPWSSVVSMGKVLACMFVADMSYAGSYSVAGARVRRRWIPGVRLATATLRVMCLATLVHLVVGELDGGVLGCSVHGGTRTDGVQWNIVGLAALLNVCISVCIHVAQHGGLVFNHQLHHTLLARVSLMLPLQLVLLPLLEEVTYRQVLFCRLSEHDVVGATAVQSLWFALNHSGGTIKRILRSTVYALVFAYAGGLLAAVCCHSATNVLALLVDVATA